MAFGWGVRGAIYAVLITVLINFILMFFHLAKSYKLKYKFDFKLFLEQIKFGISTYLGDIFSTINFKLNIFVVNIFMGVLNVGYYSVSYNIAALIFVIPYSLQQVLYPAWSSASEQEVDQKTPRVARQALLFSFLAAILLAFVGRFFILFFYGKDFLPAIMPFYLILPGGVFAAYAGIFFNNFFAKGKPQITSFILIGSLLINILLNIILIPKIGVAGAAVAASVSYLFAALLALILFWRITKTSLKEIVIIRYSDFTILLDRFSHIFTTVGKILNEVSSQDIEGLKEYYEKKAQGYGIISETFESNRLYKKIMYFTRVSKVMGMLSLKPEDKVLEIGCGEGFYTKKMLRFTQNIIATDISEKFLEKAKTNTQNMANDYVCCPAEKLPFPDNSFDKVLMSEVIEHLLDWREGVKEMKRVLKPGGIVVISTPNKLSYFNVLCHIKIMMRNKPLDGDHIKEFSRRELVGLLKNYFEVQDSAYTNYFPLLLPKPVERLIGFKTASKFMQFLEVVLSKIIGVRTVTGLIFFIKARKK